MVHQCSLKKISDFASTSEIDKLQVVPSTMMSLTLSTWPSVEKFFSLTHSQE